MSRPIQRLSELAEGQSGLITRRQARAVGVGNTTLARLVEDRRLERVAHGVYRIRGAGEPAQLGLRAAWLQLAPERPAWRRLGDPEDAVISHASAASLFEVGDLRADVHEFTLPKRRQTRRRDVRLHRGEVPAADRIVISGLPATRPARMASDLLADHIEPGLVAAIVGDILDRGLEGATTLADHLAPHAARFDLSRGDGQAALEHLLALDHSRPAASGA